MLWSFIEREKLYDIFEAVTGARLTTSYTRVGGLMRDVPHDFEDMVRAFMVEGRKTMEEMEGMLNENRIFRDRTIGVNRMNKAEAISWGLTGPLLRATGSSYDCRKANPYCGYENYDFEVAVEEGGDVWARYRIRVKEMYESLKIIDQALKNMPDGPVHIGDPEVVIPTKDVHNYPNGGMEGLIYHFKNFMHGHGIKPPVGEIYFATEAPNGELGYYLVSDGSAKPWRWRVRPPSFYNFQAFPDMCRGGTISDVVAGLSSLNIIAGELDR
jgi:NADH:ubiquinone oxidoreductase subunit D